MPITITSGADTENKIGRKKKKKSNESLPEKEILRSAYALQFESKLKIH